jgi:hypothetical protein
MKIQIEMAINPMVITVPTLVWYSWAPKWSNIKGPKKIGNTRGSGKYIHQITYTDKTSTKRMSVSPLSSYDLVV